MRAIIKKSLLLLAFPCLLFACGLSQKEKEQYQTIADAQAYNTTFDTLTTEQKAAFKALTTLQVNSDEKSKLYSTFAAHYQPCYPPDTSIIISQAELLMAMKQFVEKHYTKLPVEQREQLANAAVLTQKTFAVLHCHGKSSKSDYENGIPRTGTWVMPSVLGRSDVLMVW